MKTTFLASMAAALLFGACTASARDAAPLEGGPIEAPPVANALPAPPPAPSAPAQQIAHAEPLISCDVDARRTRNGVVIEARAFSERAFAGEYALTIAKSGGGNSSDISQGGPLFIAPGATETLGQNEISLERGARVRATLTLYADGDTICRRTFRL